MMIEQSRRSHCHNCSGETLFRTVGEFSDSSLKLVCTGCQNNGGVLHKCPHDHMLAAPGWLPLLLAGIDIVCPKCKAAYDLGLRIQPKYPDAGQLLQFGGLVVGTIVLVSVIAEMVKRARR